MKEKVLRVSAHLSDPWSDLDTSVRREQLRQAQHVVGVLADVLAVYRLVHGLALAEVRLRDGLERGISLSSPTQGNAAPSGRRRFGLT